MNLIAKSWSSISLAAATTVLSGVIVCAQIAPTNDLNGTWVATGYTCSGAQPPEKIKITQSGDAIEAVKISGDDCVQAGDVTLKGTFKNGSFTNFQMRVSSGPKTDKWFIDASARVDNAAGKLRIVVTSGSSDQLTLTRSNDCDESIIHTADADIARVPRLVGAEPRPQPNILPENRDRAYLYDELLRRASFRGIDYGLILGDNVWWGLGTGTKTKPLVDSYIAAKPSDRPAILDAIEQEQVLREAQLIDAQRPSVVDTRVVENDPMYRAELAIQATQARWAAIGDYAEAFIGVLGGLSVANPVRRPTESGLPNTARLSPQQFRQQARASSAGQTNPLIANAADDPIRLINKELIARGEKPYDGMDVFEAARRLKNDVVPSGHISKGASVLKRSDLSMTIDPNTGELATVDPRTGQSCNLTEAVAARRRVPGASDTRDAIRSYGSSTRAAMGEWAAWSKAVYEKGEYGLQEPGKSSARGVDLITAVKNPDGTFQIFVSDVKTTTTGSPGAIRDAIPDTWMNEVKDAVGPDRLKFDDPTAEAGIRDAFANGRVTLRRLTVDYSPAGQGKVEGFSR